MRSAVQQFAGHYIQNMEFSVVPLEPRQKKCFKDNWPALTFGIDDFEADDNIGLRSVNGLVVIDDDFPDPAPECGDHFLPPTGSVYGRPRKPRSKRLYHCPELTKTLTYVGIKGEHLVQLRVGLQDMCPPSVHPDTGELLQWDGPLLPPQTVALDDLVASARAYYAARLIAKYWPKRNRHDLRNAYARVLLETLGLSDAVAVRVLEWACRLGGSDEKGIRDVAQAVSSTRAKLAAGQPATGARTVAAFLGDTGRQIVGCLRKAFDKVDATDEAIEELNERYAIVSVGNKVVVMENLPDGGIRTLWSFEEFKRRLTKHFVKVDGKHRSLSEVWLNDRRGRQYDRLMYAMPGSGEQCGPEDYNGWLGYTVNPAPGDWSKNREHLRKIICGNDSQNYAWVFNWMAALVQRPGCHAFAAIVLRGGQGTGKGHFAHLMLGAMFHPQQYLHIIGAGMLTGRFNEHLSGKVLVFADESTWGGDPAAADKLKGMVTESTIPIERKFLPLVEEPSALHIVIASNNEWPISIAMDDRRFVVLDVLDTERQNDAYFAPLRAELHSGGLAAMLHELLAHEVDEHALRHPPSTKGKREVMAQSLKPIERWWYEQLLRGEMSVTAPSEDGKPGPTVDIWPHSVSKAALHQNYLEFLDRHKHDHRTRRSTETELGMFLKKYTPMQVQYRFAGTGKNDQYSWVLPTLGECRAFWAKACGWPEEFDWDAEG